MTVCRHFGAESEFARTGLACGGSFGHKVVVRKSVQTEGDSRWRCYASQNESFSWSIFAQGGGCVSTGPSWWPAVSGWRSRWRCGSPPSTWRQETIVVNKQKQAFSLKSHEKWHYFLSDFWDFTHFNLKRKISQPLTEILAKQSIKKHTWFSAPIGSLSHSSLCKALRGVIPLKGVLALGSEVVDMRLEVELEHVVLVDVLRLRGDGDWVTQQGEAGQRVVVLSTQRDHRGQDRVNNEILPPSPYLGPPLLVVIII